MLAQKKHEEAAKAAAAGYLFPSSAQPSPLLLSLLPCSQAAIGGALPVLPSLFLSSRSSPSQASLPLSPVSQTAGL
jgi:hypothetical protein